MALTGREMRPCWPQKVAVCKKSNKISELLQNELSMKDDLEEEEDVQKENDCFD